MKWPRYFEIFLACWLLVAPFFLDYGGNLVLVGVGALSGLATLTLDIISLRKPTSLAYLGIIAVLLVLWAHAYFIADYELPGAQNHMVVALVLAMFAILPTEATRNSPSWREFRSRHDNPESTHRTQ